MAKIGIQLYTVRDMLEQDYLGTAIKMKDLGYEGVEFPGGAMDKVDAKTLIDTLNGVDLELAGLTFDHSEYTNKLDDVIAYCKACDCTVATYPWIPEEERQSLEGYRCLARKMNEWGKKLADNGIQFLLHLHGYEFDSFDGTKGIEAWLDEINPDYVKMQVDVYWVEAGKTDSVTFMEKYGHLSPSIHFKDCIDRESMTDTEVGNGCIDMLSIAKIALKNNASWFIVEQEEYDKPTIEAAAISCKNLTEIRAKALAEV